MQQARVSLIKFNLHLCIFCIKQFRGKLIIAMLCVIIRDVINSASNLQNVLLKNEQSKNDEKIKHTEINQIVYVYANENLLSQSVNTL